MQFTAKTKCNAKLQMYIFFTVDSVQCFIHMNSPSSSWLHAGNQGLQGDRSREIALGRWRALAPGEEGVRAARPLGCDGAG